MDTIATRSELLTISEVAHALRVSPQTVRRRVEDGSLEHVRVGPSLRAPVRIPAEALERLMRPETKP
jgi:excisionase family DNA binding protein